MKLYKIIASDDRTYWVVANSVSQMEKIFDDAVNYSLEIITMEIMSNNQNVLIPKNDYKE